MVLLAAPGAPAGAPGAASRTNPPKPPSWPRAGRGRSWHPAIARMLRRMRLFSDRLLG